MHPNSTYFNLQINGNIVAPIEPSEWTCLTTHCDKWIYIKHVNGLTVRGNGTINGRGQKWWDVNVSQLHESDFNYTLFLNLYNNTK